MIHQVQIQLATDGRGSYELTDRIQAAVRDSGIAAGLCNVFIHHTSASLMVCENADPEVRRDLEAFMSRLAPDGDPLFRHTAEGPDDMPAHVRSVLGTWQGVYLWEHRQAPHRRRITVTVTG